MAGHARPFLGEQDGVVTVADCVRSGITKRQIEVLVANGEMRRPYRGALIDNAAPVTLCLRLWELTPESPLEFSVERPRQVRLEGVKIYRISNLPARHWRGIVPVPSPMRGLLDTAGALHAQGARG